ncbi:MAG: transposase, partial [Chloroflexi bacterium]|nr:transposase [Chloroflexota bacterium]
MVNNQEVDSNWRMPESLWDRVEPLLPTEGPKPKGGRPRASARKCMDGVFYVLRTGCQWKALPRCFGAASTPMYRGFQEWRRAGVFEKLWQAGLAEYDRRVGLEWEWQAMD